MGFLSCTFSGVYAYGGAEGERGEGGGIGDRNGEWNKALEYSIQQLLSSWSKFCDCGYYVGLVSKCLIFGTRFYFPFQNYPESVNSMSSSGVVAFSLLLLVLLIIFSFYLCHPLSIRHLASPSLSRSSSPQPSLSFVLSKHIQ